jgi:hypothetical protein
VVNVKMDIKEAGFEGLGWIQLAQDRTQWLVMSMVINL